MLFVLLTVMHQPGSFNLSNDFSKKTGKRLCFLGFAEELFSRDANFGKAGVS
jgi:hypothetical protein